MPAPRIHILGRYNDQMSPHLLSVAPMMDWTDRHDRYFLRLITRHVLLYSEMVTTDAILRGDRKRLLEFNEAEQPLALQLGGCDPVKLAACAQIAEDWGYSEINLNVGCPSDRVQSGRFGACLMAEPELVAACVQSMRAACSLPVTVKTRIGIDDLDSYEHLCHFIRTVADAGCDTFILHARKAWLQGLSPKENREIPPLQYPTVYRIKRDFPQLTIVLNGGVTTLEQVETHLQSVDGVMLGRAAYQNPYLLAEVDQRFFGDTRPAPSRLEVVESLIPYIEREMSCGTLLKHITRHVLGLFQGQPGARAWRRHLSQNAHHKGADCSTVLAALQYVSHSSSQLEAA